MMAGFSFLQLGLGIEVGKKPRLVFLAASARFFTCTLVGVNSYGCYPLASKVLLIVLNPILLSRGGYEGYLLMEFEVITLKYGYEGSFVIIFFGSQSAFYLLVVGPRCFKYKVDKRIKKQVYNLIQFTPLQQDNALYILLSGQAVNAGGELLRNNPIKERKNQV
ncbi:hypothetical protein EDC94DRAFT_645386 [Helicostylum pulchrum]|nr:hypothetical protein EDC94DRAFT_645386 [Helicostylum pulchrum]